MKPYDPNRPCAKCGFDKASTRYCSTQVPATDGPYGKEYIERQCQRCSYTWQEIPLDAVRSSEELLAGMAGELLAALAELTAWVADSGAADREMIERAQGLVQQGQEAARV
ncbi:MAG: hypothetical protein JXA37_11390 [Chloroflexia bacterium]|nr:hypothetical protein [Chloroflexia bacterium]